MRFWTIAKGAALVSLLVGMAMPSWAWRGRWWGPRVGVYIGPGPYNYPPYYYDPYYYDYYPPPPYYYAPPPTYAVPYTPAAPSVTASSPDHSHHDLTFIKNQIADERAKVEHDYEDGDISSSARDSQLQALDSIDKEAQDLAASNGGYITGGQQNALLKQLRGQPATVPPTPQAETPELSKDSSVEHPSRRDLTVVNDLQMELRALLDEKLKDGDITKGQYNAEVKYLDRLREQAQSEASSNGGVLTTDQEESLEQQLHGAYYTINHNFIGS